MRRPFLAALVCALLGVSLLVGFNVVSGGDAQAATVLRVAVSPKSPWPGEVVTLSGKAPQHTRAVVLQRRVGSHWVAKKKAKVRSSGKFAIALRASTTRSAYRVVAPNASRSGGSKDVRSTVRYVRAKAPKVRLALAPAPVGRVAGSTPGRVTVSPARKGAKVWVQKKVGGSWRTVKTGAQDKSGTFQFQLAAGSSTYRAVTQVRGTKKYVSAGARSAGWRLTWGDDMAPRSAASDLWKPRNVGLVQPGQRECSTTGANQTSYVSTSGVTAMRLRLSKGPKPAGSKSSCPHGTYRNAMVGTDTTKNFVYGVFAARVRFQSPRGIHGGFWLQSNTTPEIDTAEYFGDGYAGGGLQNKIHPTSAGQGSVGGIRPAAQAEFKRQKTTPSRGFHVYSVEWTSAGYVFRVDGVETMRTSAFRGSEPHWPVLSLLGSDWELGSFDQRQISKAYMDVDWVRVYQPH